MSASTHRHPPAALAAGPAVLADPADPADPAVAPAADPALEQLVRELIVRIADKWTMIALEVLEQHGRLRFTRLGELIGGISQKMLTKTLRQMEADGLVERTVYAVVPPRVDYVLTPLGASLGAAFCGVWQWAAANRAQVATARAAFEARTAE